MLSQHSTELTLEAPVFSPNHACHPSMRTSVQSSELREKNWHSAGEAETGGSLGLTGLPA